MFHFGLAGGLKPGLQRSVTSDFPSAFPEKPRGAFPKVLFLPAGACGHSGGAQRQGQGLHRGFIFDQVPTRAKDHSSPVAI